MNLKSREGVGTLVVRPLKKPLFFYVYLPLVYRKIGNKIQKTKEPGRVKRRVGQKPKFTTTKI